MKTLDSGLVVPDDFKPSKKKSWIQDFSEHHDFGFIDSWRAQLAPDKEQLLRQFEDTVFACANLNAEAIISTRLRLFVRTSRTDRATRWQTAWVTKRTKDYIVKSSLSVSRDDDIREVTDRLHPLLRLLDKPNDKQNGCQFLEFVSLFQDIVGSAYAWRIDNNLGVPQSVLLLPPQFIRAEKNGDGIITHYDYVVRGKIWRQFAPDELIIFSLPNLVDPDGEGTSPLRAAFETLNITNKTKAHQAALLDNQAMPSMIASVKEGIGEDEARRMEARINNKFRRAGFGGVAVLEEDTNFQPFQIPPKDMQLLPFMKDGDKRIAAAYRVPLPLIDTAGTNKATLEASKELHAKYAVTPRLRRLESILNDKLVRAFDPSGRSFVAFDDPSPQNRELELKEEVEKSKVASTLVMSGLVTPNEARDNIGIGLDPIAGGENLRSMPGEHAVPIGAENTAQSQPDPKPEPEQPEPQEGEVRPELVLNGAQIQAASDVVQQVAQGLLPRDSGIGQLMVLLNLSESQANDIMGSVGAGFQPAQPEAKSVQKSSLILPGDVQTKQNIPKGRAPKLPTGEALIPILQKHFRRIEKQVLQSVKHFDNVRTKALPSEFLPLNDWVQGLADESQPVIEILVQESYDGKAADLISRAGASPDAFNVTNPRLKETIENITFNFSDSTIKTTAKHMNDALAKLRQELQEGLVNEGDSIAEMTRRIKGVFENAETYRARRIAQTESSRSMHEAQRQAAINSGVVKSFRLLLSSDPLYSIIRRRGIV